MAKNHDLERLKALTDGVMAVSITLLVLDIRLPSSPHGLSDAALTEQFIAIWPKYLGYVTSFFVVGVSWMSHQRKFSHIVRVDTTLVWLNIVYLMGVCLVPFITAVISENASRVATTVYAAAMLVNSFLLWVMWRHADRRGLVDPRLPRAEHRHESMLGLLSMSVFVASIAVAQFSSEAARLLFFALLIPSMMWRAPVVGD
jgi:uncharacterized membrane protein